MTKSILLTENDILLLRSIVPVVKPQFNTKPLLVTKIIVVIHPEWEEKVETFRRWKTNSKKECSDRRVPNGLKR